MQGPELKLSLLDESPKDPVGWGLLPPSASFHAAALRSSHEFSHICRILTDTTLQCNNAVYYSPSYRQDNYACVSVCPLESSSLRSRGLYLIYLCITGPYTSPPATQSYFCPLLSPFLSLWEGGRLSIATSLIMKEIAEGQR